MLKTVEDVANELSVSKAAIYKKIKSKEYESLVNKEKGKLMINDDLFSLIKKNIRSKIKHKDIILEISESEEKNSKLEVEEIKEESNDLVSTLVDQLKEKDKQIEKLHGLIENNQVLIKNQQYKEIEQLKLVEHFEEVDKKLFQIREKMDKKKNTKKSIWEFFKNKY